MVEQWFKQESEFFIDIFKLRMSLRLMQLQFFMLSSQAKHVDMPTARCQYCTYLHITPTTTPTLWFLHICLHNVHKTRGTPEKERLPKFKARNCSLIIFIPCTKTYIWCQCQCTPIQRARFNSTFIFFRAGGFPCIYIKWILLPFPELQWCFQNL